ncbi:hypothetical protein HYT01_00105 [Candidatus Giovannonibacteria bacterium]|nr:hypothetical protein [Candidatus Giovannonibacteria bacterium]
MAKPYETLGKYVNPVVIDGLIFSIVISAEFGFESVWPGSENKKLDPQEDAANILHFLEKVIPEETYHKLLQLTKVDG